MGTIADAFGGAIQSSTSYSAVFRYHADLAKGLSVGDGFIPVISFSTIRSLRPVFTPATDDQSILIALTAARKFNHVELVLVKDPQVQNMVHHLLELKAMDTPFLAALGVTRWLFGKPAERYILRDNKAKLGSMNEMGDGKSTSGFKIMLVLPAPELRHGTGETMNLRKV